MNDPNHPIWKIARAGTLSTTDHKQHDEQIADLVTIEVVAAKIEHDQQTK